MPIVWISNQSVSSACLLVCLFHRKQNSSVIFFLPLWLNNKFQMQCSFKFSFMFSCCFSIEDKNNWRPNWKWKSWKKMFFFRASFPLVYEWFVIWSLCVCVFKYVQNVLLARWITLWLPVFFSYIVFLYHSFIHSLSIPLPLFFCFYLHFIIIVVVTCLRNSFIWWWWLKKKKKKPENIQKWC